MRNRKFASQIICIKTWLRNFLYVFSKAKTIFGSMFCIIFVLLALPSKKLIISLNANGRQREQISNELFWEKQLLKTR